ncbi:MAG: hypothetical protein KJ614_16915 [Gammaproteobacteria bacterium]|uniref:glycosyl hydrolase family 18 protein n=1 Tax=Rhodoferax sp. TaxID=50421 RepID=UPI001837A11E|nr:glycosyl hydrolase family 18 protein [Rhodoferax sp.]MBU3900577.1 hypothetical protein [Gammaproteobacteria bacterium]MBA3057518.1 hypothetical protein [Rhodoferax sp.]MBU3997353.1 hypothetical protein [Gammaproteobacteria bacterium]MBU4080022.1 hypothetical protein [Gammaproteobacteria bacterium]MBU4172100.1 hypothetical protein [Gammaproteobacteria bacterium]
MHFRRLSTCLLLALLLQGSVSAETPKAWGYIGWWQPQSWRTVALGQLDRLLFFELKVSPTGEIAERHGWPEKWADLRLAARQNNTPLDLTLTLFEPAAFNTLFSSTNATVRLLDEASSLAGGEGVNGLQLDFEIYSHARPDAIDRYREFVGALSKRLRLQSPPKNLSVFLPVGGESRLYDAATLGQVDHVVLQGYDSHWLESKAAGPVAPLTGNDAVTWEKAVALGASLGVPNTRMLLGFPLYGYEWMVKGQTLRSATIGKGSTTSFAPIHVDRPHDIEFNVQDQVRRYGASHDTASGSSYYQFRRKDGQYMEGWFEDWWTLGRKIDYLLNEQLGGIAFFSLGYDDGQLVDYFFRRRGPRSLQDLIDQIEKAKTPPTQ